jgi:hypothetical protein
MSENNKDFFETVIIINNAYQALKALQNDANIKVDKAALFQAFHKRANEELRLILGKDIELNKEELENMKTIINMNNN